jgi:sulfane dehydrogenase subunit SoxC
MTLSRRRFIAGAAATAGLAAAAPAHQAPAPASPQAPEDPTKVPGKLPSELGERSPFERPRRLVNRAALSGDSETPLQDLEGIITPADLHFERHHAGIPTLDPARYRLLIHGMVDRPLTFSLAELKRFPAVTRTCFIECSGNGSRGYHANVMKREATPQWIDGLVSTSEWTGVPLATVFREAGVQPRATWFLAEGWDAARMTRSIPVEKAMEDALLVYAQNGEAIRPAQGYPVRLLLPGWEGNAQIKWLRRLELSDAPFFTKEETAKYTDPLGNSTARIFSFAMDAKSTLTFPVYGHRITPGWWEIRGLAWTGRGKIARVDLSTDGGKSWTAAELGQPVLSRCQTRFRKLWRWNGEPCVLLSRAVDETGYVQPTRAQLVAVRGAGTFYHFNNIRAWKVERDGRVFFEPEAG